MGQELFTQYAGDDGTLSQEEFIALYFDPQADGPLSEEQLVTIFQASAGDDGQMTYDELKAAYRNYYSQITGDGDENEGGMSEGEEGEDEGEEGGNDGEDADCSNPIGGAICPAHLQRLFTKHDSNNDNKLAQNEWLNLYFDPTFDGPASE